MADGIWNLYFGPLLLGAAEVRAGLWSESPPIVGVNAHSADPHYQPGPGRLKIEPSG